MSGANRNELEARVSRADKKLILQERSRAGSLTLLDVAVVSGCEGTGTPAGTYRAGRWIEDKTNPVHGRVPWSKDPWGNPYGPYFLPLNDFQTGRYTTFGIHGTRGPLFGNFEKPPLPQAIVSLFMGADNAKYLYCSHGCIRLSNQNVVKLFKTTAQPKYFGTAFIIRVE